MMLSRMYRNAALRSACLTRAPRRTLASLPRWATLDPSSLGSDPEPHAVSNLVGGTWKAAASYENTIVIPNPMDRDAPPVCILPDTQDGDELRPFVESMRGVPKSGVHNPLKNVERYLQFGEISRKVCHAMLWYFSVC